MSEPWLSVDRISVHLTVEPDNDCKWIPAARCPHVRSGVSGRFRENGLMFGALSWERIGDDSESMNYARQNCIVRFIGEIARNVLRDFYVCGEYGVAAEDSEGIYPMESEWEEVRA